MIKKALFADELAAGMQSELRKIASGDTPDLVKAGECLHAALEILEDAGLQKHADKVLGVLEKIANPAKAIQRMPSLQELLKHGLTHKDLQQFGEGHHGARAKINRALRNMGMDDNQIASFIGKHNVVPEEDLKRFEMFSKWIEDPTASDVGPIQPGQSVTMQSLPSEPSLPTEGPEDPTVPKELSFQSIAAPRHPGRPDKIHDPHTSKLTPDKMVANLKHHGTEFNMPDLGWASYDPEGAQNLDTEMADDLNWNLEDILDAEVLSDESHEPTPLDDFEDEVSLPK